MHLGSVAATAREQLRLNRQGCRRRLTQFRPISGKTRHVCRHVRA
jgi:hypothetical protein